MPPAPPNSPGAKAREQLLALLSPIIEGAGFDLEDVTVTSAGRRSLVRVVVDSDHGVDLDAVADVSRLVSDTLDGDADGRDFNRLLPGSYTLEVTSPGVDRPLTEPRHWRRATGRLVAVEVAGTPLTGRVTAADERSVSLLVGERSTTVPFAELGHGRVQVEFNHPAGTAGGEE